MYSSHTIHARRTNFVRYFIVYRLMIILRRVKHKSTPLCVRCLEIGISRKNKILQPIMKHKFIYNVSDMYLSICTTQSQT